jgi:hypothetical protein
MRAMTLWLVGLALGAHATPSHGEFASAEAAVQALAQAVKADNVEAVVAVLGEDARPLVESGDPVQDERARARFLERYEQAHEITASDDGYTVLDVGKDKWPFPLPLVEANGTWRFDVTEGAEEIIDRRVGDNELAAIQVCLAFVDAQREYYQRNPQETPLMHFARRLVSTDGQRDGLYWPTTADEPPSPVGDALARAQAEGYFQDGSARDEPYHGYVYRMLTGQGPNARGGAYSYLVGDRLLGGFALLAVPAEYGSSGVMSFIVSHDGVVDSTDLGENTAAAAEAIQLFDPDDTWKREATIDGP